MNRRNVIALWAGGLALGALSVGCGLVLGLDYGDANVTRTPPGGALDGGFAGDCAPRACGADECGFLDDGCGGVLHCNGCDDGASCRAGRCRCNGSTCLRRGAVCGTFDDGCGGALECGACTIAQEGCTSEGQCRCQPRPCPDGGAGAIACGSAPSGCGQPYVCGADCPGTPDGDGGVIPSFCGGGGQNLCGPAACVPVACEPGECGQKSNGCDGVLECGECDGGVCGANGIANQCGCEKTTCARLGRTCGTAPDGCGGILQCNDCEAPETCSDAGSCSCTTIDPAVACAGKTCGFASDGCRGYHPCGPACPDGGK